MQTLIEIHPLDDLTSNDLLIAMKIMSPQMTKPMLQAFKATIERNMP